MRSVAALLSFGIPNAVHYAHALASASEAGGIQSRGAEANKNNVSTDPTSHKENIDHGSSAGQQQTVLGRCSEFTASLDESVVSGVCPQSFHFGAMGSIEQQSHFKKIQSFKVDYTEATVTQYESQRTGMRVSVVDRKGPKVCMLRPSWSTY
jgi:hypothetical protein